MFAGIVLLSLYLQLVKGYSPTAAGLLTLPQVAGTLACPVIAGQVTSRTGRYKILPMTGSVLLLAGMLLLCCLTTATGMAYVESVMFLLGADRCLYMLTITLSMQNALPQADLGVATSSNTFFRQVGGTAGAAMFLSVSYSAASSAIRTAYAAARSAGALRAAVRHGPGQAATVRLASSIGVRPRSRSSRTCSSVRCQACVPGSRTGRRDAPEPESTAALESLLATVCIRTMLNVLDHDRMLSLVDAVDDPPLSGEPRAAQPAELTPKGLADTARHIQQRAGDEFHCGGGHVLRQPLRDRSSSGTGHPELVPVSAHFLRSASSARAASVP